MRRVGHAGGEADRNLAWANDRVGKVRHAARAHTSHELHCVGTQLPRTHLCHPPRWRAVPRRGRDLRRRRRSTDARHPGCRRAATSRSTNAEKTDARQYGKPSHHHTINLQHWRRRCLRPQMGRPGQKARGWQSGRPSGRALAFGTPSGRTGTPGSWG